MSGISPQQKNDPQKKRREKKKGVRIEKKKR
jgi:hypothetical protein